MKNMLLKAEFRKPAEYFHPCTFLILWQTKTLRFRKNHKMNILFGKLSDHNFGSHASVGIHFSLRAAIKDMYSSELSFSRDCYVNFLKKKIKKGIWKGIFPDSPIIFIWRALILCANNKSKSTKSRSRRLHFVVFIAEFTQVFVQKIILHKFYST